MPTTFPLRQAARPYAALLCAALSLPAAYAEETFLPAEEAFTLSTTTSNDLVQVQFKIADGYYLYKHRLKFAADGSVTLQPPALPGGHKKTDRNFGEVETYRDSLSFPLPYGNASGPFTLTVTAQGCADGGLCYPPFKQTARIDPANSSTDSASGDDLSRAASVLNGGNLALIVASFFGFGLLLAFTPCVFPMIPILSGIIVGHGANLSKRRALMLSAAYVLGMAVTYTAAGVAAALTGTLLSAALQNAWVLGGFAMMFVVLSFSMFGFYELQLPASLQSRLSDTANRQKGGSIMGVSLMGALSALIVGPCVAAPLAGALLYIAQTNNAVIGGAALFAMAMGMGAPLIVVGVAARSALPRAGMWMEGVKKAFGVMLLGVALWLVSPVVSPLFLMLALAALLIISAMYLHALDPLPHPATGWQRFWKGAGVVALLCGAAIFIGALAGSRDPLQPLAVLRTAEAAPAAATVPAFTRVSTLQELDAARSASTKPVLLDFYADWCVSCKEMERFTFSSPDVAHTMKDFTLLQVDMTENTDEHQALLKNFAFFGPPAIAILKPGEKHQVLHRIVGYQPPEPFKRQLGNALAAYQR